MRKKFPINWKTYFIQKVAEFYKMLSKEDLVPIKFKLRFDIQYKTDPVSMMLKDVDKKIFRKHDLNDLEDLKNVWK